MSAIDLKALLKRVYELVMPDIRAYYRVVRKGKIVASYAVDGNYWADVQPLKNDESVDEKEPIVTKVEIPVIWAGPSRGVICPPELGTLCDLSYFDGDPNYPRISNFRWQGMSAPVIEVGGFIIQRQPGTHIKIDKDNNIFLETPAAIKNTVGGNKDETVGGSWNINVSGAVNIASGVSVTVQAPTINLAGNISTSGAGGGAGEVELVGNIALQGNLSTTGNISTSGNITASGNIMATGSNSNHHGHP